jgi:membrane protease YdiL (CAAX protease family)
MSLGTMPPRIAGPRERWGALGVSAAAGLTLAAGFLPTTRSLAQWLQSVWPWGPWEALAFPALAGLFFLSVPSARNEAPFLSVRKSLWSLPFPILVSALYGWFHPSPTIFQLWDGLEGRRALLWFAVCVPVGEEWLFRGWVQGIAERLWPGVRLTETNPLPVSLWASALAFSLWHLQNLSVEPWGFVLFQVLYTLLTGLWLAYLRWATGRILPCVLGHFALNVASNLW